MITTVTLNPAIDKTITVEQFRLNTVNRVLSVNEDLGGKGINVSKVLHHLKHKTVACGFIGEANYGLVQPHIKRLGLSTDFVWVDALTRINTKIIDPIEKSTTDINETGFTVSRVQIEQLKIMLQAYAKQSSFMVFSGSVCKGIDMDGYQTLVEAVAPTPWVLDADRDVLRTGLELQPYLIKPNIHELEDLLRMKLETNQDIVREVRSLMQRYKIHYCLVSMGEKGSVLIKQDLAYHAKALDVELVTTVGAGDAMLAGFLFGLSEGHSDRDALRTATACGAIAVSGVALRAFDDFKIEALIDRVELTQIDLG